MLPLLVWALVFSSCPLYHFSQVSAKLNYKLVNWITNNDVKLKRPPKKYNLLVWHSWEVVKLESHKGKVASFYNSCPFPLLPTCRLPTFIISTKNCCTIAIFSMPLLFMHGNSQMKCNFTQPLNMNFTNADFWLTLDILHEAFIKSAFSLSFAPSQFQNNNP